MAPADNYAARSGSCRKPPGAPYNRNGRKRRLFFRFSALNRQAPYEAAARQPFRSEIIRKEFLRVSKSLATRQELIPYTALASLSIGDNRVNVDTERQRNPGSVRIPPPGSGTIPEMRLDLFGLRPHRCNQLEIVKGRSIFGHLNPGNRPPTDLTVQ